MHTLLNLFIMIYISTLLGGYLLLIALSVCKSDGIYEKFKFFSHILALN